MDEENNTLDILDFRGILELEEMSDEAAERLGFPYNVKLEMTEAEWEWLQSLEPPQWLRELKEQQGKNGDVPQ